MGRAYDSDILQDAAGNTWSNALGTLYTDEALTTPVTDNYTAAAGGTLAATVTSDSGGRWKVYFTTEKSYWIRWTNNGGTAYPSAAGPSGATAFAAFTSQEHQAFERAAGPVTSRVQGNWFGDGGDPNAVTTQDVGMLVSSAVTNPSDVILQHFVGYSFYTGTPGGGVGTLQGGSSESVAFLSPSDMGTVLGFEGIGRAGGDAAKTISTVIGMQSTASASGPITVGALVGFRASGPSSGGGSPTVTVARSFEAFEPTIGTTRQAFKSTGAVRMRKGNAANVLELSNASDVLQWSSDGTKLFGYASDGTSVRVTFDATDGTTAGRFRSLLFGGTGKHATFFNDGTEVMAITAVGNIASNTGTGIKIFTSASEKGAFWNATPVAQQLLATGAAHTVDDVIALLQTIGLCKQS